MTVGITGHQNLDESTVNWVRRYVIQELEQIHTTKGMSCLAIGADQIFAEVIIEKRIDLIAVIPSRDYEGTFDRSKDLDQFREMLKHATNVIQMDNNKATETAFYQASQYIVDCCDYLFAVWDSKPSKGFGGTADVVSYADRKKKRIIHFNPYLKAIKYYNYDKS